MHPDLANAENILDVSLPALKGAAELSHIDITEFKGELLEAFPYDNGVDPKNIDVVLLGSHARGEATQGSDCDYFVLQRGASPLVSQQLIFHTEKVLEQVGLGKPGGQGVFGDIVIAAMLSESIGLESDTNQNMTRRLLLLTESKSVYSEETRKAVIEDILSRYCIEYMKIERISESPAKVPRFLLNDLVRYWRTMAVDFGAKRWRTLRDDSYIRLAKLMTTRKILFAGPLATLLLVPNRVDTNESLQEYLTDWLAKPPLAQLASTAVQLEADAQDALASLLVEYDKFVGILNQPEGRKILHSPNTKEFRELSITCKEIGYTIQQCLEVIFYDSPLFKFKIRKYGIF